MVWLNGNLFTAKTVTLLCCIMGKGFFSEATLPSMAMGDHPQSTQVKQTMLKYHGFILRNIQYTYSCFYRESLPSLILPPPPTPPGQFSK